MSSETKETKTRERRDNVGGGGKILAFFLGLIIGIGAIAGTVAAVVSVFINKPVKEITTLIDGKENGNTYQTLFGTAEKVGFLNAAYAEQKVSVLLGDAKDAVSALSKGGSLNDLNKLSPKVGDTLSTLLETTDKYEIPLEKDALMSKPLGDLGDYAFTQVKETPLGGLLKAFNDGNETTEPLWLSIAYGEEDIDYTYDETGNVVMLGDSKKTTINGLLADGGVDSIMDKMTLASFGIDNDNSTMRAIAYGPKSHYELGKKEGKTTVTMKQVQFTRSGEKILDIDGNEVSATYVGGVLTLASGEKYYIQESEGVLLAFQDEAKTRKALYPKTKVSSLMNDATSLVDNVPLADVLNANKDTHRVLLALAYGSEENYDIVGDTVVPKAGVESRTIGELKKDNAEIINGIGIGDAMGIDATSPPLMLALAYGNKDEDYKIVDGKIVMQGESKPRTLGDFAGENSEDIFNDIYLGDAMNLKPGEGTHSVMLSLAYGTEGKDYQIVGTGANARVEMLGDSKPRTIGDITNNSEEIINDIPLTDIFKDPDTDSEIMMYILYGREDVHYHVETGGAVTMLRQRIAIFDDGVNPATAYNAYGEPLTGVLDTDNKTFTVTEGETVTVYNYVDLDGTEKVKTVQTAQGEATFYYLNDSASQPLYYEPTTIGELSGDDNPISSFTTRLTVGEILGEDSANDNIFLKHVKNETIQTLPESIEKLSITDVYAKEIYKTKNVGEEVYFVDADGVTIANVNDELTDAQKDRRVVTGTWWYLLHDEKACYVEHCPDGENCKDFDDDDASYCDKKHDCETRCDNAIDVCHEKHCPLDALCPYVTGEGDCDKTPCCVRASCTKEYAVTDLGSLITNMTYNMQKATLVCLHEDGIITLDDATLKQVIKDKLEVSVSSSLGPDMTITQPIANLPKRKDGTNKTYLQELTISEMLEYAAEVLTAVDDFQDALQEELTNRLNPSMP